MLIAAIAILMLVGGGVVMVVVLLGGVVAGLPQALQYTIIQHSFRCPVMMIPCPRGTVLRSAGVHGY